MFIQKISNHPQIEGLERFVQLELQVLHIKAKIFEFKYSIVFKQNGNDVSLLYQQPVRRKITATEKTKILLRDEDMNPIPDPEWNGISEDDYDKYLWETGWDAIERMSSNPSVMVDMFGFYVAVNDADGWFD